MRGDATAWGQSQLSVAGMPRWERKSWCPHAAGTDDGAMTGLPSGRNSGRRLDGSKWWVTAIRTIFAQPDAAHVREQPGVIAGMLGRRSVKVETMLPYAAEDLRAFTDFPAAHGNRLGARTRWNGSTKRCIVAPMSSECSRTRKRCYGWPERFWSKPTTSGRPPTTGATSAKPPWHYWPAHRPSTRLAPSDLMTS